MTQPRGTLGDILRGRRPTPPPDALDIFNRWSIDTNDPSGSAVARRLLKTWRSWTFEQRWLLLETAEAIARAERAKAFWNPKAEKGPHRDALRICRLASDAARLAAKISTTFPPPWDEERAPIGEIVTGLVEFVSDALETTTEAEPRSAVVMARWWIERLKEQTPKHSGRASWPLIAELASLAGGQGVRINESAVRRYLHEKPLKGPLAAHWKRYWALVVSVGRVVPDRSRRRFDKAMVEVVLPPTHTRSQ